MGFYHMPGVALVEVVTYELFHAFAFRIFFSHHHKEPDNDYDYHYNEAPYEHEDIVFLDYPCLLHGNSGGNLPGYSC